MVEKKRYEEQVCKVEEEDKAINESWTRVKVLSQSLTNQSDKPK